VCKQAPGRGARHHDTTHHDVVARAFASTGFPVSKKPTGLSHVDRQRPDDTDPMVGRQASSLGCDCHLHICQLICRGIGTRVRRRSRNCSHTQRGRVFQSTVTLHSLPNSHRDTASSQCDCKLCITACSADIPTS